MELRPYQTKAVRAIFDEWGSGKRRTLLVLPTGCGKTVVFSEIIKRLAEEGRRSLILAHRGELLDQAADKIRAVAGLSCAVEKAEATCVDTWNRVVVGSVQTLMRDSRLKKIPRDFFQCIVVDEAHHAMADSYRKVLEHFSSAHVLGVTATPDRADRKNLGQIFDSLAYEYSLPSAIKDSWLVPIEAQMIPIKIDIKDVSIQSGDYAASSLGDVLAPYLGAIADAMIEAGCKDRKTVVFLPLIKTSQAFAEHLRRRGFHAAEVNGLSESRSEILRGFNVGRYNVLCNSMLLTEGWDCPSVDCIVVLRPTKSRSLYCQMVGRGTRISPGKSNLLLLDFLWMTGRHELCRPAYLVAQSQEIADRMHAIISSTACPTDLIELEQIAVTDVQIQREKKLAEELARQRHKKAKLVDPLLYEMSICDVDLQNYVPEFSWMAAPATDKQKNLLIKSGINPENIDAGKASLLISKIEKRKKLGMATPKQVRMLEKKGFQHPGTWTFKQASAMMARLSRNRWIVPKDIDVKTFIPNAPTKKEVS